MGTPRPDGADLNRRGEARSTRPRAERGTQLVAVVVSLLLALTMVPAAGIQSALADEPVDRPATTGGDVPLEGPAENTGLGAEGNAGEADGPVTATVREDGTLVAEGLVYKSESNGAVLVGFEDGNALEREVSVPERLTDGALEYTVKGVNIAESQTAPGVLSLELPQTAEDINTKSLAAAMPSLARVSVDGRGGAYSSANGMLFRQESVQASSDGSTTRIANRELVWAPPAMVIARVPGTCKTVASGAFVDDKALETVMVFSIVESVAKTEKDESGNTTKEGAFTDEQVSKVNIVTPMETLVYPEGDRVSADAFLSQDEPLNEKHIPWCDCGFSMERFTVGIPYGSTSLAVAIPGDGKVGTPEITIGHYTDHPEWDPKGDTGEPDAGLVFEYKADMTVSVTWKGDKAAVPSHLELPAYVIENGVKTAVTEVAPGAFEGATQLESLVIPEGFTAIGEFAFEGCSNLVDVDAPSTLRTTDYLDWKPSGSSDSDYQIDKQLQTSVMADREEVEESSIIPYYAASDYAYTLRVNNAKGLGRVVAVGGSTKSYGWELDYLYSDIGYQYYGLKFAENNTWVAFSPSNAAGQLSIKTNFGLQECSVTAFSHGRISGNLYSADIVFQTSGLYTVDSAMVTLDADCEDGIIWGYRVKEFPLDASSTTPRVVTVTISTAPSLAVGDQMLASRNWIEGQNYIDKAVDDLEHYTKTADFGTVAYAGLEDATVGGALPTTYIKGANPSIPDPKREGYEFTGWTWAKGDASGDGSNLANAFSSGGAVTFKANWEKAAPEANVFFADEPLDSTQTGVPWSTTIAVKLTGDTSKTSVSGVQFALNDMTGLLADPDGVEFAVGPSADALNTTVHFGAAPTGSIGLTDVDGGRGILVKITIPAGGIDKDRVVGSQAAGDYVASLARMTYAGIA